MTLKRKFGWSAAIIIVVAFMLAGISKRFALWPLVVIAVAFVGLIVSTAVGMIFRRYLVAHGFGWVFILGLASFLPTWIVLGVQERITEGVAASVALLVGSPDALRADRHSILL
jgi:hypothetical protein